MLDGRVARLRGRETKFGAYLDSTMDRYSDMLLYLGLLILYARLERTGLMVLVWVAAFGSFMTSYARARAESLIPRCTVGFMERPERVVLVIVGALLEQDGRGPLDHRRPLERHRHPARRLHLRRAEAGLEHGVHAARREAGRRVSFGPKGERARRQVLGSFPVALWMWKTLPLAAFAGLRVVRLDAQACSVSLPGGWRTQNPFRSTYFAAQAMAAEMSTGAPALVLLEDAPASVAMLVVGLRVTYTKKLVGEGLFTFEDVAGMRAAVDRAAASDQPQAFAARSVGPGR